MVRPTPEIWLSGNRITCVLSSSLSSVSNSLRFVGLCTLFDRDEYRLSYPGIGVFWALRPSDKIIPFIIFYLVLKKCLSGLVLVHLALILLIVVRVQDKWNSVPQILAPWLILFLFCFSPLLPFCSRHFSSSLP